MSQRLKLASIDGYMATVSHCGAVKSEFFSHL
jgi:hypothetical protein